MGYIEHHDDDGSWGVMGDDGADVSRGWNTTLECELDGHPIFVHGHQWDLECDIRGRIKIESGGGDRLCKIECECGEYKWAGPLAEVQGHYRPVSA